MKIAYLTNQYPNASSTFIRREIVGMEANGITISRFAIRPSVSKLVDEADLQEVAKTRYILRAGAVHLLSSLLQVAISRPNRWLETLRLTLKIGWRSDRGLLVNLVYMVEACVLLQWCKEENIQHLHAHFSTNPVSVAMLCHALGGPTYSFTVHGPHEFDKPEAIALPEKIHRAAFVVGISSFSKSQLFRWCSYKQWSKIHIIRCGVDEMFLTPASVPMPKTPRFVCVGRLDEQKGHLLLVEAVSQLAAEGLQFKVVLVGDGPLRSQIETLISQLNLQNHIELTGWASNAEVRQQILAAQIMVMPSFAEGLPVVIMESLALSRPVISTYIAGIPELVKPGECGWLVPAGSVEALAAAMRQAMQTSVIDLEQMGKTGAALVVQNHNAALEASRLADLFRQYVH
ncbi:glycosyltransferase [Pantanalinema sp. GBBB05]|uniref:glycosyltransferase n=1 Tax=Pantanalinema sp. GBBB05 TaxID=2604139 RepID=UPI001D5B550D|nr:glycosyltransferase family 4 protein [Pantanalinema sp. GBBB05]